MKLIPLSDETDASSEEVAGGGLWCAEPPGRALRRLSSMLFDGDIPEAKISASPASNQLDVTKA